MNPTALTPTLLAGLVFVVGALVGLAGMVVLSRSDIAPSRLLGSAFVGAVGSVLVLLRWPGARRVFVLGVLAMLTLAPVVVFLRAVHGFAREAASLNR